MFACANREGDGAKYSPPVSLGVLSLAQKLEIFGVYFYILTWFVLIYLAR